MCHGAAGDDAGAGNGARKSESAPNRHTIIPTKHGSLPGNQTSTNEPVPLGFARRPQTADLPFSRGPRFCEELRTTGTAHCRPHTLKLASMRVDDYRASPQKHLLTGRAVSI